MYDEDDLDAASIFVLLAGGGALSPDEGAILPAMPAAPQGFLPPATAGQAPKASAPTGGNQTGPWYFMRSGKSALMQQSMPAGWQTNFLCFQSLG